MESRKNTLHPSSGRGPWFNEKGEVGQAYVIGIAGGSASGKTRLAEKIIDLIKVPWVLIVSQDSFYLPLTPEQSAAAFKSEHDFDSPTSFDYPLIRSTIKALKENKAVRIPKYSFTAHAREVDSSYVYGATVIILEGIFVLHDQQTRDLLDLKLFVQCDSDLMLTRRLRRDILERGRDVEGVLTQYLRFVKPSYDDFVSPTRKHADMIVPGENNAISCDFIINTVRAELREKSIAIRGQLFAAGSSRPSTPATTPNCKDSFFFRPLPASLFVMEPTTEVSSILGIMRDRSTPRIDFCNQADNLAALITTSALAFDSSSANNIVGVSVLRSGASLEVGVQRVVRNIEFGSMLIQNDSESGEPRLININLPEVLRVAEAASKTIVLLLDSQIGTGAAALMAIRVLLDHGVEESNIIFCCFLVSRIGGIHPVSTNYPGVRIQTGDVDPGLEERYDIDPSTNKPKRQFMITPGLGSLSDRYYGVPVTPRLG